MANNLTADIIAELIATKTKALAEEIAELRLQLNNNSNPVQEYQPTQVNDLIRCDESFDVIKSIPEFAGSYASYVSWREAACSAMKLYKEGSRKYVGALTILRNKITGKANDTLTNHGTVLNFEAILARLDFAYSDRRPIHIIEQELSVLRQGNMTVLEYYNLVNKKLTLLTNKTIMTYGNKADVINEMNSKNRESALRIFITGLNGNLPQVLFSIKPENLPNALAKAQELEANHQRANFAYNYYARSQPTSNSNPNTQKKSEKADQQHDNNLRFNQKNQNNYQQTNRNVFAQGNSIPQPPPIPMEIDKSLQIHNRPQDNRHNSHPLKREYTHSTQQQPQKAMRVNNLNEEHFLEEEGESSPTSSAETEP